MVLNLWRHILGNFTIFTGGLKLKNLNDKIFRTY